MAALPAAFRPKHAHESTLPIEDWAKGIGRAFSKRRTSSTVKHGKPTGTALTSIPSSSTIGSSVTVSTTRTSNSSTYSSSPDSPTQPIKNWINNVAIPEAGMGSQQLVAPPSRSPARLHRSLTSGSGAPSLSSGSARTDWNSDNDSLPKTPSRFYRPRLEDLEDISSSTKYAAPGAFPADNISVISSRRPSEENIDLTAAMLGVEESLRSLFYNSTMDTMEKRERRETISDTSSTASFTTADEISTPMSEPEVSIEEKQPIVLEIPAQNPARSKLLSTRSLFPPRRDSLPVIPVEEEAQQLPQPPSAVSIADDASDYNQAIEDIEDASCDSKSMQDVLMSVAQSSPYGSSSSTRSKSSVEDILSEVAQSSPYADSIESSSLKNEGIEVRAVVSSDDAAAVADTSSERESDSISGVSSNEPISPVESCSTVSTADTNTSASLSSGSTRERVRVRPARHYKMVNGMIVQYEPWKMPVPASTNTSPASVPKDDTLALAVVRPDLDREGSFQREVSSRWTYTGSAIDATS